MTIGNTPDNKPATSQANYPANRGYTAHRSKHPRGLLGQLRGAILQPGTFFRTLPTSTSQHWLIAAILILGLVGASAIRQRELGAPQSDFGISATDSTAAPVSSNPDAAPDPSLTWKPALTAGSKVVLNWLFLSAFLMIVPLTRSARPGFGQNLRMVVWASLPIGIMAGLQLLYYASGGQPGKAGISGLLPALNGFDHLPTTTQTILISLSSQFTIFGVWVVVLIYIGARNTLNGPFMVVVLVIVLWISWIVLLPVAVDSLTQQNSAPMPTVIPMPDATQGP